MREIWQPLASKIYQTLIILPNFLSMVVVAYLVYGFLHPEYGFANYVLENLGMERVKLVQRPKYWPFLLPMVHWWKQLGYKSVVYLASVAGIDKELYEAAVIDGAGKWNQAWYITIPQLTSTMIIMFLLALGNIFRADFGLFYQVTMNSAMLYEVTDVIDTYVYRALTTMNNIGMSSAASFYQSVVGAVTVVGANLIVRKIDRSQAPVLGKGGESMQSVAVKDKARKKENRKLQNKVSLPVNILLHFIFGLFAFCCFGAAVSAHRRFPDAGNRAVAGRVPIHPRELTLEAYKYLFETPELVINALRGHHLRRGRRHGFPAC